MSSTELSTVERIIHAFDQLGLREVHLVACASADWADLISQHSNKLRSFVVVAPHLNQGIPEAADRVGFPSLVVAGDQGAPAIRAQTLVDRLKGAKLQTLADYESPIWADTVADRADEIERVLRDFWDGIEDAGASLAPTFQKSTGELAGIHYRIEGNGPPVLFLPLSLAPSQWDPLISRLKDDFTIIILGGAHLGAVALLEGRAKSGYGDLLNELLEQTRIAEGERILEVGCGSGALARQLARQTNYHNKITASDLNPYLLSEAKKLATGDAFQSIIEFDQADAERLHYEDAIFDVSISSTVMEEGNADRMIAELFRVTKPGGRVVTVVRATDVNWWTNLPLPQDRLREINSLGPKTGAGMGQGGCADASLYERLTSTGLKPLIIGPRFACYREGERLRDVLGRLGGALPSNAKADFDEAVGTARSRDTLCIGEPFHCAISKK